MSSNTRNDPHLIAAFQVSQRDADEARDELGCLGVPEDYWLITRMNVFRKASAYVAIMFGRDWE